MVVLALALALAAALFELLHLGWSALVRQQFVFVGVDVLWLTPLSYCLAFGVLGLVGSGIERRWPRARRGVLFVLSATAAFSMAFLFHPALHLLAAMALAAGAGWQLARALDAHAEVVGPRARRVVATGLALMAGTAASLLAWRVAGERAALSRLSETVSDAPNVLLLILDTVRAKSLGLYGYSRPTSPAIEAVARHGITFDRAISPSPWTLPAHASIFTGRPPHLLHADWEHPLEDSVPTLAEAFRASGYRTGGFVGNVAYASREVGLARGFTHYEDYVPRWSDLVVSSSLGRFFSNNPRLRDAIGHHDILGRRTAAQLNTAALRWIDQDRRRPFFVFINYYDAHEPYLPAPPFDTRFGSTAGRDVGAIRQLNAHMAERAGKWRMPPEQQRLEQLAYDQAIAWLDDEIGRLLQALEARGIRRRTVIAITADHGEQFGEHGLYSHGNSLYLAALHVPLVLAGPGIPSTGMRRDDVVSTASLGATLLAVSAAHAGSGFPGASLFTSEGTAFTPSVGVSSIRPARNQRPDYPSAAGDMFSATSTLAHVVSGGREQLEMFDLVRDPDERLNLAGDGARRAAFATELAAVARARAESRGVRPATPSGAAQAGGR